MAVLQWPFRAFKPYRSELCVLKARQETRTMWHRKSARWKGLVCRLLNRSRCIMQHQIGLSGTLERASGLGTWAVHIRVPGLLSANLESRTGACGGDQGDVPRLLSVRDACCTPSWLLLGGQAGRGRVQFKRESSLDHRGPNAVSPHVFPRLLQGQASTWAGITLRPGRCVSKAMRRCRALVWLRLVCCAT